MEIPFLEPETIEEKAAQLCRAVFDELPRRAVDLDELVYDYLYDEHGVAFYNDRPLGGDEQDVLGMTFPVKNEIHVDARLAESGHRGRYRFTVAHEIGHWVLHRPLFVETTEVDRDARLITFERDVEATDSEPDDYRPEEWQANQFAIYLLLNDPALGRAFDRRFGEPPVRWDGPEATEFESLRDYTRHLAVADVDDDPPLVEWFELSAEAIAIAMEERGYAVDPVDDDSAAL